MRYNLKTPHALHYATAVEVGATVFLTGDRALPLFRGAGRGAVSRVLLVPELPFGNAVRETPVFAPASHPPHLRRLSSNPLLRSSSLGSLPVFPVARLRIVGCRLRIFDSNELLGYASGSRHHAAIAIQNSLHSGPSAMTMSSTKGPTWWGSQRAPLRFIRTFTRCLIVPSTRPLPIA